LRGKVCVLYLLKEKGEEGSNLRRALTSDFMFSCSLPVFLRFYSSWLIWAKILRGLDSAGLSLSSFSSLRPFPASSCLS